MTDFVRQYLETMLWSTNDDETPLDDIQGNKGLTEFVSAELIAQATKDCERFCCEVRNAGLWDEAMRFIQGGDETTIAHDFWLTRNGHGAGFWDGDYEDYVGQDNSVGDRLTVVANKFGECNPYLGDDGMVYAL